ncbi:phytoene/squalene synthase family protein [Kordiimonas marina]|uniref:phytoene/squalene synthase family protein n=1 Tax=Kordiimonas marina TaxID=2872312 RepID=UPI001FF1D9F8|nr:squalene/phytoene synthase family protein [Kordiimonas marina]MCJ9428891.1 squalene/phytoene synthase family protein [Kordiimonas marina]
MTPKTDTETDKKLYCQEMVRRDDPDRYYATLFAPADHQGDLFALYAFNQEVAKTRESVSEPMLGEIRLQWWREALEGLAEGTVRAHPVVEALAEVKNLQVALPMLHAVIEARGQDMYDGGTADFAALEAYADGAGGALQEAAAVLVAGDDTIRKAARASGRAFAMLGLVRALPYHWQAGRSYVPQEADVDIASFTEAEKLFPALKPTIERMTAFVQGGLEESRAEGKKAGRAGRSALALNGLSRLYLRGLEKAGMNPFELAGQEPSDLKRLLALAGVAFLGRV